MRPIASHSVSRQVLCAALTFALVQAPVSIVAQQRDEQLELGVKQVEGGDFDAAVITLDGVVRRLSAGGASPKELARAHTYLGITYLSLGQETAAKARFLDALKVEPGLKLDPKEFPPKVVQFFDQVKAQAPAPTAAAASPTPAPPRAPDKAAAPVATTTTTPPAAPPEKKGGGSKALFVILGVGAAAGIAAVAAGGGGGGSSSPPPPTTLAPTTLADLSATVSSPQSGQTIRCTQETHVLVQLSNRGHTGVTVTGVRRESRTVSGGCGSAGAFTYPAAVSSVAASSSVSVLNRALFSGGSGCCNSGNACDGRTTCQFEYHFAVITSLGEVNTGTTRNSVTFKNCATCSALGSSEGLSCPSTEP